MSVSEHFFSLDHPAAKGHFPGNPIIPGAVLLSETLQVIEASAGMSRWRVQRVSAKFLHPARPGNRVRIEFSETAAGAIKFACAVGQTTVMTGVVAREALSTLA